jgi:hypothetical protein
LVVLGGFFVRDSELGIDAKMFDCNLEIGTYIAALTGREPSQHGGRPRMLVCDYNGILDMNSGAFSLFVIVGKRSMRSCLLFGPFAYAVLAG